jgi:signal transduction histidine kinase
LVIYSEERTELLRHQAVLSRFGELALRSDNLDEILTEACRLIGEALNTDLAKVMELLEDGQTLLVRAGVGWNPGVVGHVTLKVTEDTSEGLALKTGRPMISPDIGAETRFTYPAFLTENGVKAVANVIIIGVQGRPPFGILQIDSRKPREFTADDVIYLQSYANLIAAAVDRLRAVDDIRDGEVRLRLALEAGALGSWEMDLATGIGRSSDRTIEIFGYDEPPPIWAAGVFLHQVVREDRKRVVSTFREAVSAGTAWQIECRITRANDGEVRWIEGQGQPDIGRRDTSSRRMRGIVADITARKVNEETLRHAQKMEAVGQLTGGIAHDFNNLLTIISGSLELLESELASTGRNDIRQYVSVAQGASSRAAALTHRLLAFARRQPLHPKPTDPHRLVLNMADLIRQTVGPEIKVKVKTSANLWSAFVDGNQLENALLNLCVNARDAMPHGGNLIVETSNVILTEPRTRDDLTGPRQYVALRVTDNGTGMSADVIAHAFEPFFTTKPIGVGTGLGLSTIHGYANQSNGHVSIDSQLNTGTAITIYLPRHLLEMTEIRYSSPDLAITSAFSAASILIVDDISEVRMVIARALSRLGYSITEAPDGATGLKM